MKFENEGAKMKNCLNCMWEPDWSQCVISRLGKCRKPDIPHAADLPWLGIYVDVVRDGDGKIVKNCPAWQPKHEE